MVFPGRLRPLLLFILPLFLFILLLALARDGEASASCKLHGGKNSPDFKEDVLGFRDKFLWRDWFNRKLVVTLVSGDNRVQPHKKPSGKDFVNPMLIEKRYRGLTDTPAFLSKNTPRSESPGGRLVTWVSKRAVRFGLSLKTLWSLSFWYTGPWTGKGAPYPCDLAEIREIPKRPEAFKAGADAIAGILTKGPFSVYATRDTSTGDIFMDLSSFEDLRPQKPFVPVGGVAKVEQKADGGFATVSITFQGKMYTRNDSDNDWLLAQKRFLVALNSYATLIDHLVYCHIVTAGTNALSTILVLDEDHPLRILLQPFIVETTKVNNKLIDGLILRERSNVPSYTGYPLKTVNSAMRNAIQTFDIRHMDPVQRYTKAGLPLDSDDFPTIQSTVDVFNIYQNFTESWCSETMGNQVDEATKAYIAKLEELIPNGVLSLVGIQTMEELTMSHVAHIAATLMFTGSVWHHVVNDLTGAYLFTFDMMPPAMDKNGHPTRGVVLEKRNSIVAASVYRYYILPREGSEQTVYLETPGMEEVWNRFEYDLKAYKQSTNAKPQGVRQYYIDPYNITSSIHA